MPIKFDSQFGFAEEASEFIALLLRLKSPRKVRPVITRSGARARGVVPSMKASSRARFESLVERDMLQVLEVSSLATAIHTHPFVLALPGEAGVLHYTPDVVVEFRDGGVIVEAKGSYFLRLPEQRERLAEIVRRLRREGFRLVLATENDIRVEGLQEELSELLRMRPFVARACAGLDTAAWDPLGRAESDFDAEQRWIVAQRECDALLARLMRRDPGELLPLDA